MSSLVQILLETMATPGISHPVTKALQEDPFITFKEACS